MIIPLTAVEFFHFRECAKSLQVVLKHDVVHSLRIEQRIYSLFDLGPVFRFHADLLSQTLVSHLRR